MKFELDGEEIVLDNEISPGVWVAYPTKDETDVFLVFEEDVKMVEEE